MSQVFGVSVPLACVPSSNEEQSADPPSPLSAKRRVLSRSALQSHQPVARPVAMGLSRYVAFGVGKGPGQVMYPFHVALGDVAGQLLWV